MEDQLYTSGEVAAQLEIPRWRLLYLIEKGEVSQPTLTVPGRRLFTPADIERIRHDLGKRDTEVL